MMLIKSKKLLFALPLILLLFSCQSINSKSASNSASPNSDPSSIIVATYSLGEVTLKGNLINFFKEKPQISSGWINGGFFVFNKKIFKFIKKYSDMLEKSPLESLVKKKQLVGYKHYGFWQCMDTLRDKELLNKLIKNKKAPWMN